jgi:hypothetical protein
MNGSKYVLKGKIILSIMYYNIGPLNKYIFRVGVGDILILLTV